MGVVPPLLLGGLLALEPSRLERWPFALAWEFPVGEPTRLGAAPRGDEPPFQMTRGVAEGGHEGADLSNRRGGDPVRAAAHGLVIATGQRAEDGFGLRVVLAHREGDARVVYSVYSHLAAGSITVSPGDVVALGQELGRVGMTGRATSPHLHFEVRVPERLDDRWEKAHPVDPVAFVEARLPTVPARDSVWTDALTTWGEGAGLIDPTRDPAGGIARSEWWCALAVARGLTGDTLTRDATRARERLVEAGVLDPRPRSEPDAPPTWKEIAHDLGRLGEVPLRLPPAPLPKERLEAVCRDRFAIEDARDPAALSHVERDPLTRIEAALLLATHGAPKPSPRPRGKRRGVRVKRRSS